MRKILKVLPLVIAIGNLSGCKGHVHTWDEGKVTTPATHLKEGEMTYTCTDCQETKIEPIAKTTEHSYGAWTKLDDSKHVRSCECGVTETHDHEWGDGVQTKAPTHTEEGVTTYTCVCGETKTEPIAKTSGHNYGLWVKEDENQHKRVCACGDEIKEDHRWGNETIKTEATHLKDGVKTYTCVNCSATKEESYSLSDEEKNQEVYKLLQTAVKKYLDYDGSYRKENIWHTNGGKWKSCINFDKETKNASYSIQTMGGSVGYNSWYYNNKADDGSYKMYNYNNAKSSQQKLQYLSTDTMYKYFEQKYNRTTYSNVIEDGISNYSLVIPAFENCTLSKMPFFMNEDNCTNSSEYFGEYYTVYAYYDCWHDEKPFTMLSNSFSYEKFEDEEADDVEYTCKYKVNMTAPISYYDGEEEFDFDKSYISANVEFEYSFYGQTLYRVKRSFESAYHCFFVGSDEETIEPEIEYYNEENFGYEPFESELFNKETGYQVINYMQSSSTSYEIINVSTKQWLCEDHYTNLYDAGDTITAQLFIGQISFNGSNLYDESPIDKLYLDPECTIEFTEMVAPAGLFILYCRTNYVEGYATIAERCEFNGGIYGEFLYKQEIYDVLRSTPNYCTLQNGYIYKEAEEFFEEDIAPFEWDFEWVQWTGMIINGTVFPVEDMVEGIALDINECNEVYWVYTVCDAPENIE